MTAQVITVKLMRGDNTSPWGFRLQGGKDFGQPLTVQKVNPGSLSDQAGLLTSDGILKIQGKATENLKHSEAQDIIIKAGNNLEMAVQRGGIRLWQPTVTPVGDLPTSPIGDHQQLLTKTSLAHNLPEPQQIGSKHNVSAKPFGASNTVKALVHNPYNSPVNLYSMQNIADTLSAQTEVLASGAKGINFMKEDKPINKESDVYRMVHAEEVPPSDDDQSAGTNHVSTPSNTLRRLIQQEDSRTANMESGTFMPPTLRHVEAPTVKPASEKKEGGVNPNACFECGKSIFGVFVRIKDKPLHPECFKCSTCGTSLRNVGYFNVNDKLYCDIHAKQAAKMMSTMPPLYEPASFSQMPDTIPAPVSPQPRPYSPIANKPSSPLIFKSSIDTKPSSPNLNIPPSAQVPQAVSKNDFNHSNNHVEPITQTARPYSPIISPPSCNFYPQTAPTYDAHSQMKGSSRFVWPPPKTPGQPLKPAVPCPVPPNPPFEVISPAPKSPIQAPFIATQKQGPATAPKPYHPIQSSTLSSWTSISTGSGSRPAPRRGRGQLKSQVGPGVRIPICSICGTPIRGPFVTALGKTWCPDHFLCANNRCHRPLQDIGFVEEQGQLYCEICYEAYFAPQCSKCGSRIKGDCLNALEKPWHPQCFVCAFCHQPFGNSSFYMEDGQPYCEKDWNELFTTKCVGCGFSIEAGDRWVEALNNNYHSNCFKCTICLKNLEGQSFYAKGGRPFCKAHAR